MSETQKINRKRLPRGVKVLIAILLLLNYFWYPQRTSRLFRAIPETSIAAVRVRSLSARVSDAVGHKTVQNIAEAFGYKHPDSLPDDAQGVFWTTFFLTGRDCVFGVVPAEGECGGLGFYLAGSSAVGLKARVLELLWRVKYVPFLGPLYTTAQGTRYMQFDGIDQKLGLDIVDGILVAVWADDPDRVMELSRRLRDERDTATLATAFNCSPEPWRVSIGAAYAWMGADSLLQLCPTELRDLVDDSLADSLCDSALELSIGTIRDSRLELTANAIGSICTNVLSGFQPLASYPISLGGAADCDARSPLLLAAACGTVKDEDRTILDGSCYAWLSGDPYMANMLITQVPSAVVVVPSPDIPGYGDNLAQYIVDKALGRKNVRLYEPEDGTTLIEYKKLSLFGVRVPEKDCFFVQDCTNAVVIGNSWGAYRAASKASAPTMRDTIEQWRTAHSGTVYIAAKINFSEQAKFARTAASILRILRLFSDDLSDIEPYVSTTSKILWSLRDLGNSEILIGKTGDNIYCDITTY